MKLKMKSMPLAILQVIATGALSAFVAPATAQQAADANNAPIQRVEITGSSIKRIQKEGALPVQVLSQEEIKKTGATTATDLLQALPAMQGFVPAASSINTGGGGGTTAALHSLASKYTLVLLDGQRLAPSLQGSAQGGGFAVNLESIPLDAIERVEILTDGAGALYGSDAIAGVVNFITKKNKTDTSVFFNNQTPQHPGGRSYSAGISKGWGDLDTDGFNILASYSHDFQHHIQASSRGFSRAGGYIPFSYKGQKYVQIATSGNNEPGNLNIPTVPSNSPGAKPTSYPISPYYNAHGNCGNPYSTALPTPAGTGAAAGISCNFNFASFVQDNPTTNRDSGILKGTLKINANTTAWAEMVVSDAIVVAQFAPPSQPLGIGPTQFGNLYQQYVVPFLAANQLDLYNPLGAKGPVKMGYRPITTGGRADKYETYASHFATGIDGQVGDWTYNARLVLSHNRSDDSSAGGYLDSDKFKVLVAAGTVDPLAGTGGASLAPALLNGQNFSTSYSDMNMIHVGAQRDLFELPGGTSVMSLGSDYGYQSYKINYADIVASNSGFEGQPAITDQVIGGNAGAVPSNVNRKNAAIFGEFLLPVMKNLEVTASGRYDSYGKAYSKYNWAVNPDPLTGIYPRVANGDVGNSFNGSTYKLQFKFTPVNDVLLRGSYGTGFKAPSLTDLVGPLANSGSSNSFACPFPGIPTCLPGAAQYDLVAGGNGNTGSTGLKPEKSKQWTLGFRVEPVRGLSLGADLWSVNITKQVQSSGIPQATAFGNAALYEGLFIKNYLDPQGFPTIAYEQIPGNGGYSNNKGVDWDTSYRTNTAFGKLNVQWTGTYMLKQDYTLQDGGEVNSDLGQFGADQNVVFRTQMRLAVTMQTGAWTNTIVGNYKSRYKDQSFAGGSGVYIVNADGTLDGSKDFEGIDVASHTTFDWQTKFDVNKNLSFAGGIHNMFDRKPPLTLQAQVSGNSAGYDPRYADVVGRAFYVRGNYSF